jgi:hypothetical protein
MIIYPQKLTALRQFIAIQEKVAAAIDPVTAELHLDWRRIADPFDRLWARPRGSEHWVSFHDLSAEVRDALWPRVSAGFTDDEVNFPYF